MSNVLVRCDDHHAYKYDVITSGGLILFWRLSLVCVAVLS
jgi:hypothetical protein